MLYSKRPMFKSVIAPMQAWLLSQGRCVGCGTELSEGKKKKLSMVSRLPASAEEFLFTTPKQESIDARFLKKCK